MNFQISQNSRTALINSSWQILSFYLFLVLSPSTYNTKLFSKKLFLVLYFPFIFFYSKREISSLIFQDLYFSYFSFLLLWDEILHAPDLSKIIFEGTYIKAKRPLESFCCNFALLNISHRGATLVLKRSKNYFYYGKKITLKFQNKI